MQKSYELLRSTEINLKTKKEIPLRVKIRQLLTFPPCFLQSLPRASAVLHQSGSQRHGLQIHKLK